MIRFFAKRRYRKGFTLTEMIVVTALVAILMAAVATFAGPVRRLLHNANAKSDAVTINNVIGNYIEHRLAYANYIDIYVGMPYTPGSGDEYGLLEKSYENVEKLVSNAGQKNTGHVLIFKYIDKDAGSPLKAITDPLSYTYRVYDYEIKKGTSCPTNLDTLCDDDSALFTDNFYGNYQYFFTMDNNTVAVNTLKKRAYLNFRIDSFKFEGNSLDSAGKETGLTATDIINYHKYIDEKTVNSATTTENPFDKYTYEKTGSENVSFSLENISNATAVQPVRGRTPTGSTITDYATDIIIFYNVRTYDLQNDT